MDLDFRDLIIATYSNSTKSEVRVTHKPTGKFIFCDRYETSIENRKEAIRQLKRELGLHDYRIALDFDGVLHGYSKKWHDGSIYDPPVEGALEAIKELAESFELIIFTCRVPTTDIQDWIQAKTGLVIEVTNEKPHADMYIDDRGYYFDGDWSKALTEVYRRDEERFTQWC